ncbi:MAG: hypothetical protein PHE15_03720 [Dehalococcoidales bacterium]|nr:hypothetical protein [Dehalococcoidales bacterium]
MKRKISGLIISGLLAATLILSACGGGNNTTTTSSTTASGESLEDILGNVVGITSFTYDMVITSSDGPTQSHTIWCENDEMRMDLEAEGEAVVYIWDGNTETTYIYYPSQNIALKVTTYEPANSAVDKTEGIMDYNPTIIGTETLDGKVCLVVEYTYEGTTSKMWIWKQYGFPIRVEVTTTEGTTVMEYKNISFEDIADSIFELPEGVQIVDFLGL